MVNLNNISWNTIILKSDIYDLEAQNGMPIEVMLNIMSQWNWQKSVLKVFDVRFRDGHPHSFRVVGFTDYNDRDKEEFLEFMFDVSLTHKVMFVEDTGSVFVTESSDGQTNIDAGFMEELAKLNILQ